MRNELNEEEEEVLDQHDRFRQALLEDVQVPGLDEHLANCPECNCLAARLRQVDRLATAVEVPDPPPDLVEKILRGPSPEASGGSSTDDDRVVDLGIFKAGSGWTRLPRGSNRLTESLRSWEEHAGLLAESSEHWQAMVEETVLGGLIWRSDQSETNQCNDSLRALLGRYNTDGPDVDFRARLTLRGRAYKIWVNCDLEDAPEDLGATQIYVAVLKGLGQPGESIVATPGGMSPTATGIPSTRCDLVGRFQNLLGCLEASAGARCSFRVSPEWPEHVSNHTAYQFYRIVEAIAMRGSDGWASAVEVSLDTRDDGCALNVRANGRLPDTALEVAQQRATRVGGRLDVIRHSGRATTFTAVMPREHPCAGGPSHFAPPTVANNSGSVQDPDAPCYALADGRCCH